MLCVGGLFLVKAANYRVYYRVEGGGGGVFRFEAVLVGALREVRFNDSVYD